MPNRLKIARTKNKFCSFRASASWARKLPVQTPKWTFAVLSTNLIITHHSRDSNNLFFPLRMDAGTYMMTHVDTGD
jgi:hypothetical protein